MGDYGSDIKLDYTFNGHTVNVGSRLEAANKVLGTVVLVDETTRRQAGDSFAFRPMGLLALRGKRSTVAAYELVGATESVSSASGDYIALFECVIRDYQACNWDSCLQALRKCRSKRSDDRAVDCYERAVEAHRSDLPADAAEREERGERWSGALSIDFV